MFAFVFRLVGCLILAAGTAFAIGDTARSLAAEALRLTSVSEAVALLSSEGSEADGIAGAPIWALVGDWPVSPTLAAVAVLFLLFGRRRPQTAYER